MKHIMERHDDELLKKVFLAQKRNPTLGDFAQIVEKDLTNLKVTCEDQTERNHKENFKVCSI